MSVRFNVLMCKFYKFYICAVVGTIIDIHIIFTHKYVCTFLTLVLRSSATGANPNLQIQPLFLLPQPDGRPLSEDNSYNF